MNLIIIGFIIALIVLSMFWAFNTVRRIELQKNFCAGWLISIAKNSGKITKNGTAKNRK